MLVRVFRVTDKFSNALLKLLVWLSAGFLDQVVYLRETLETTLSATILGSIRFFTSLQRGGAKVSESAFKAYQVTDQRRRAVMAQRASTSLGRSPDAAMNPKEMVMEDPLLGQNRMLSAFTVLLLVSLIGIVLWATQRDENGPGGFSGILPQNTLNPTVERLPSPAPTTTSAPILTEWRGTLIFSVHESGQDDLFALQPGRTEPLRLTNNPADDRDPAWSPDGRTVAFVSNRDHPWELYIMDVVTKEATRLTYSQDFIGAPTWSPDGLFLAYEGYTAVTKNLDIYIVAVDGSQGPTPLTSNPGPDIEPAWLTFVEPDPNGIGGRRIAYTSIRNGQQDIFIFDLNNPSDSAALNVTNTPDSNENYAAWSPDGRAIAYSTISNGIEEVFYRAIDLATNQVSQEFFVGRGRMPIWEPRTGQMIFYTQERRYAEYRIIAGLPGGETGESAAVVNNGIVADLDWTPSEPTILPVVANYPPIPPIVSVLPDAQGLFNLAELGGVRAPDAYLNALVFPSFNALRAKALEKLGKDYLAVLDDALWLLSRSPEVGQPRESWHYAGRAFALPRNQISEGNPRQMVVVREDREAGTFWRVYVRVNEQAQDGVLGEPLRVIPWDFELRNTGDPTAFENGGGPMTTIPDGYYVDFTQLAADYGWFPIPSSRTWRQNFPGVLFWVFVKDDSLNWQDAMRQLYSQDDLNRFLNNEPVEATPIQEPTTEESESTPFPTIEATRTATPIPPDAG